MKVHYKLAFPVTLLVSGFIIFAVNLYLINTNSRLPFQLFLGLFLMIIGAFSFKRPIFELRTNEIVLFNAFGMVIKRYPFDSMEELVIVDNKIYMEKDGQRQRVRISNFSANKAEWDRFISMIRKRTIPVDSDLIDDLRF